ncbi:MAG: Rossmann-like and DUF2520 domain-containing protein [Bacteroidales bacterium]
MKYNISFIGAGNCATRMAIALKEAGHTIDYIYNRTDSHADRLINSLNRIYLTNSDKTTAATTTSTDNINDLCSSDIIIISVSDNYVSGAVKKLASASKNHNNPSFDQDSHHHKCYIFHTSGATCIDVMKDLGENDIGYGVLYPLMTLSRSKDVNFEALPFLLEASDKETEEVLENLTSSISKDFQFANSEKRLRMHCAAVFSCNFINYLLSMAYDVAGSWSTYLMPTTIEMVRKSFLRSPDEMRTGPAVRGDMNTIHKHLELLERLNLKEHKEVYEILTRDIMKKVQKKKNLKENTLKTNIDNSKDKEL